MLRNFNRKTAHASSGSKVCPEVSVYYEIIKLIKQCTYIQMCVQNTKNSVYRLGNLYSQVFN